MRPALFFPPVTIIECTAHGVTAAVWSWQQGAPHCRRLVEQLFMETPATEAAWLAATEAAIRALGLPAGPVTLLLPPERTLTKMLPLPPAAREAREQIIRFELGQSVPTPLEELVWGHAPTDETGAAGGLSVVIAAKRTVVETLCAAVEAAGLTVSAVWPAAMAARTAFRLAVAEAPGPALLVVPTGAATVIIQMEAHRWALRVAVGARADDPLFGREVGRTREAWAAQLGMAAAKRIYWHDENPSEEVAPTEIDGLPVERWGASVAVRGLSVLMLGAAALALRSSAAVVDLLPAERRRAQWQRRLIPWCAVAALLGIAAWVPPLRDGQRRLAEIHERTLVLEAELAVTQARAATLREGAARLATARQEIAAWREVAAQRTAWVRRLADWQERLAATDDGWLEKIHRRPTETDGGSRLVVTGWLVDRENPAELGGAALTERVQRLRASFDVSPWAGPVVAERYDPTQPGRLRFEWEFADRPVGSF